MPNEMLGDIVDNVSAARGNLSHALSMAQIAILNGTEPNGWHAELARLYGEVEALERTVQAAAQEKAV